MSFGLTEWILYSTGGGFVCFVMNGSRVNNKHVKVVQPPAGFVFLRRGNVYLPIRDAISALICPSSIVLN